MNKKNKDIISEKTMSFRYKIVFKLIKLITPQFYNFIDLIKHNTGGFGFNVPNVIRPSTLIMKQYFSKREKLIGVELGVQKGRNAMSLLKELPIKTLYLIDIWSHYNESDLYIIDNNIHFKNYNFVLNKFRNNKKVKIIKGFSNQVVKSFKDNSLDFIYIDANHRFDYVYQDIDLWSKKVKKKGVISGHDIISFPSVLKAVISWCENNNKIFFINIPDWYIIK